MIETASGVANLDEIAATPGLDGLYVGPADLTLGVTNGRLAPGFDRTEDEMVEVIKRIAAAAQSNGTGAVLHCGSPEYAAKAISWGYNMVTVSGDVRLLATAAADTVSRFRQLTGTDGATGEKGAY
jgi:4-hydroxy-2-oxoheptanedioate aldolase